MVDIDKILKKNKWTAREIGLILIATTLNAYAQAKQGNKPTLLIDSNKFSEMIKTIKSQKQIETYNNYYMINDWIRARPALINTWAMGFEYNFIALQEYYSQAEFAENVYRYVNQLPKIMTEQEFNQLSFTYPTNLNYNEDIAILTPNSIQHIDEAGNYTEPDIYTTIRKHSLEIFFQETQGHEDDINNIVGIIDELKTDYYYIRGVNLQIDLTIKRTGLNELEIYKRDIQRWENNVSEFNNLIKELHKYIEQTPYKDKELQAKKLKVLEDNFPPIDIINPVIPKENIEKAKELVSNFTAYGNRQQEFDELLCYRPGLMKN